MKRLNLPAWVDLTNPAAVWIGIAVAGVGFVLLGIAWAQVAGETQVYLQLPYLVSAGMTGLGLIMVGLTLINVSTKRRDALERERQMDQLVNILEEVKGVLGERGGRRK
jgi:apolipoprotein N-acyltransferase